MGWFSKQLPDSEKEGALALVHHLQEMIAYQQLATEIYNDACTAIAGDPSYGAEVWRRRTVAFSSPALVSEYIIPALKKKIEIFQLMEKKHKLASSLAPAKLQLPYQEMTSAIHVMLDRAHLQYDGFTQWIQSPQTDSDVRGLDKLELSAIDHTVKASNDLIKKAGLTRDERLDLDQEVFNSVRISLGLVPLARDVFRSRFLRGNSGERVRFFSD